MRVNPYSFVKKNAIEMSGPSLNECGGMLIKTVVERDRAASFGSKSI